MLGCDWFFARLFAASRGCPIIAVQFELSVNGQLSLDTHAAYTSIDCIEMGSFSCFSSVYKSDEIYFPKAL